MKRLSKAILLSLVAALLASMPIMAAVAYRAAYTIVESGGTDYDMLPTLVSVDNQWLADNGFLQDDALDTRIETLGGAVKPHMVATNKTLTAVPVPADSQTNLYFTTANSDLNSLDIIEGYDGYVTITDDTTLELGSDFEIEQSGYVDTDAGADKNLVYKEDAFIVSVSAEDKITVSIPGSTTFASTTSDGEVKKSNAVYNTAWIAAIADTAFSGGTVPLGQRLGFDIWRCFLYFDTSALPGGATILSATLRLYGSADNSAADFLITIQTGSGGHPEDPLVVGDYDKSFYSGDGGSLTTVGFNLAGYNDIALNATGRSWINTTGTTEFGIRSSEDIAGSQPAGDEWLQFYTNDWVGVDKDPQLVITYEVELNATDIDSGEYTVKTYGVANEPQWATGDVLHFPIGATSNINSGTIHNAAPKLWVSLWFKLDADFSAGDATQYVITKRIDGFDYLTLRLQGATGQLQWFHVVGNNPVLVVDSTETSWNAGQWYHAIASLSDDGLIQTDARLIVEGGTPVTDTDAGQNPAPNGGNFVIGDRSVGNGLGFGGVIANVIVGTDDLTVPEEAALYAGIAPGDETNYWYIDEGTGTGAGAVVDYGTGGNAGNVGVACTWETSTFTTGSTGRLCDFYIEVDDGVTDPDRWGANLKGATVPPNGNDWILNQNNVMPYMDYYKHTVGGVEHAWYQPNYMVEATDYDGTETAGGSAVTVTDNTMTDIPGFWVNALVTITASAGAALGESRVCTVFAAGGVITVAPAFSANIAIGDTFTIDFGTLIDRSYYGLGFDGINDVVTILDDPSLDFDDTGAFTVEAWINITVLPGVNWDNFIDKGDFNNYGMRIVPGGELSCAVKTGGFDSVTGATPLGTGTWYHTVFTALSGGSGFVYLNGVQDGTAVLTAGAFQDTADDVWIGRSSTAGTWFDGLIDEVRIYNRVLDLAEIQANYNAGVGSYTPYNATGLVGWWHMEEGAGVGAILTDSSGEGNTGTITGATWVNGKVPRPAGNSGTNDSRLTWGVNPTGVGVTLGGMVSEGQPTPGALPSDPAQDILPETEVTDWYIEPDVTGTLLTNPLRPFVTMWSDNSTLTELQCWRIYALALILLVTVATAMAVGHHQGITMIMAGVALLGAVVLTIFPMWALVFAIGMFIGGLVMERAPSL